MHAQLESGVVALDHPPELEGRRRALGHHPHPGLVPTGGEHQPAPRPALDADGRGQPTLGAADAGLPEVRRQPRPALPVDEQAVDRLLPRGGDQHVASQVLEHHRAAHQVRGRLDQPRHRRPREPEVGEGLVDVAREPHLVVLLGHDRPVHRLGHLDEPDRAVEHHQGEVGGARPTQRLLRHRGVRRAQLDDQPGGADLDQLTHEVVGGGRRGRHRDAGAEHQLVADQHGPDVAHLRDVRPPDPGVQTPLAAEHHRVAGGQHGEREGLAHGDGHAPSVGRPPEPGPGLRPPLPQR